MTIRQSSTPNYSSYDASADLSWQERQLSKICFICGLDGSNPTQYVIDDIISAIDSVFFHGRTSTTMVTRVTEDMAGDYPEDTTYEWKEKPKTGSNDFIFKKNGILALTARRSYRKRRLAEYQGSL